MPAGDDDIEIRVILRDEFSRDAEDVIDAEERMGRAARDTADAHDDLSEAQRRQTEETRRSQASIRAANRERDEQGRFIVTITNSTERETTTIRRNTRERDRGTKSIFKMVKGFIQFGKILQLFKIAIMVDGIAKAIAGLSAVGGIAVGAIGGLAPLTGVLLPLPALLAGAGLALATFKMGFSGIGEALKAYDPNDLTKFNEAIKDLGPNGKAAALGLAQVKEQFKPIQKMVQETLLADFGETIRDLGDTYFPVMESAMDDVSKRLKGVLDIATGFLGLPSTVTEVSDAMGSLGLIAEQMGHTFNGALRGTLHMFSAVAPVAILMSEMIAQGVNSLADSIFQNEDKIRTFAKNGLTMFQQMMGTVVDLFIGFKNIAKIGAGLFDGMGGRFGDMAEKFRKWTQSVEGQQKIQEYFDKLRPILESIIGLVKDLVAMFGRIAGDNMGSLAPMIDKFREMVPSIEKIVTSASGAAPAFLDIANAILQIVGGTDMLTPSAAILEMATPIIEGFANVLLSLPQSIQTAIGWIVTFGLVLNMSAMGPVRAYIMQLRFVQIALLNLRVGFTLAALAAKGFALSMLSFLFTNPIGWIILGVIALIALFVLLWNKSERFREIIKSIGQWFVDVWNNQINPLIQKTWQWMQEAWDKVLGIVYPIVDAIVGWIKSKWDTIVNVFNVFVGVVKTVFTIVWTIISTYVMIWWTIFSTAFNLIKTVVMTVFNVIASIISTAVGIWLGFIMPVVNTIIEYVKGLGRIFMSVVGVIVAVWKLAWAIIRLVVNVAILIVMGIIKLIVTIVMWVADKIIGYWQWAWGILSGIVRVAIEIIKLIIGWIWDKVMAVFNPIADFVNMVWMAASAMVSAAINIIMGYIQWIWDKVMSVFNPIAEFIGGVWNTASGYVNGAITLIGGYISGVWTVVQSILASVQQRFESVWGTIRDFVMGIIKRITDALDGIKGVVESITGGISGVADFVGGLIPGGGLAAGGAVKTGLNTLVGEKGPEAFVGSNGKVSTIGSHGPEIRNFKQPGYVVPNHVLGGQPDSSVPGNVMNRLAAAVEGNTAAKAAGGTKLAERSTGSQETYMSGSGDGGTYVDLRNAQFGDGVTKAEVKAAVKEVIKEVERNKKERGV